MTYGNALTLNQGYDNQYRISSIVVDSIVNLTYGYDPNGNINSILDAINPPGGQPPETVGTYSYQQGTNKLTHFEGTPSIDYGYDSNGNITAEGTWAYVYDLSNQLIRALQGENQVGEYTFNEAGQRVKKVTQTETRIFHYDSLGHIIAETNQTGQMLAEYIYLGDQLLTMIKPGESAYYFHNDHLGTPQVLTDATQTVVWKAAYTPFGEAVTSIATVENPFRFPGQYYDAETGLHYNYYRYYNPPIGRYLTPDPIGLDGGINEYIYVLNAPTNSIDPRGLWVGWIHKEITDIAAFNLNCKKIVPSLGDLVAGVDGLPGSQEPQFAFWHAMVNGKRPMQYWDEDIQNYWNLIGEGSKSCQPEDISKALHALQDSYAPAHQGFKPWFGGIGIHHWSDAFWTSNTNDALAATSQLLGKIIKNCPCLCQQGL